MQKGYAHTLLVRNLASAFLAPYLFLFLQMGTVLPVSAIPLVLGVIIISQSFLVMCSCLCVPFVYCFGFCSHLYLSCGCSLCLCVVGFSTVPAVEHTLVFVQETPRVTLLGVLFLLVQLFDASEQPPSESL